MTTAKTYAAKITAQMNEQITSSIAQGIDVNVELYQMHLDMCIELEGITFETPAAKFFFEEAVNRSIDRDLFYAVFPKHHTNANGVTTFSK